MKKILSLILCMGMLATLSVSAMAQFSDMPEGEDGVALQKAVDNGLITGFEDGTVRPQTPITRAQMATIMSRAMNAEEKADISAFADVKEGDWYYDAMAKAVYMDAFKGDTNSCLNPNNTITRQEAFIVLCRIFDIRDTDPKALNKYSDAANVASWAAAEARAISAGGYLGDIAELRPLDPMTRLEFAQIMGRIVNAYIDADGEYSTLPEGNVLVRAKKVSFKNLTNDNIIYIGDGVQEMVNFNDCVCEKIVIRGKLTSINSGLYGSVRGIGNGSEIYITDAPKKLAKKYEDGRTGSFYAAPGKAVLIPVIPESEFFKRG